jgi:hypothetical protein
MESSFYGFLLVVFFMAIKLIADDFPNFSFMTANAEKFDKKSGGKSIRKSKKFLHKLTLLVC